MGIKVASFKLQVSGYEEKGNFNLKPETWNLKRECELIADTLPVPTMESKWDNSDTADRTREGSRCRCIRARPSRRRAAACRAGNRRRARPSGDSAVRRRSIRAQPGGLRGGNASAAAQLGLLIAVGRFAPAAAGLLMAPEAI